MGNQPFYMRRLCVITESKTQNMHPPIMLTNAGYRNGTLYYVSSHTHTQPPLLPPPLRITTHRVKKLWVLVASLWYMVSKNRLCTILFHLFLFYFIIWNSVLNYSMICDWSHEIYSKAIWPHAFRQRLIQSPRRSHIRRVCRRRKVLLFKM